jgi:hypothetical protein
MSTDLTQDSPPLSDNWIIDNLLHFHKVVKRCQGRQHAVDITVYCICSILLVPSLVVLVRTFFVREKAFLLIVNSLLIIGEVAGIVSAFYIEELIAVAVSWNKLFHADQDWIRMVTNIITYSIAIFFSCFTLAHWLFSMQYWSLSFRLKMLVEQRDINSQAKVIYPMAIFGLVLNGVGFAMIVVAFHS